MIFCPECGGICIECIREEGKTFGICPREHKFLLNPEDDSTKISFYKRKGDIKESKTLILEKKEESDEEEVDIASLLEKKKVVRQKS